MRLINSLLACLALVSVAPATLAQGSGTPFNYSYVDISYLKSDAMHFVPSLDGYRARMSYGSADGARLLLSLEATEETHQGVDYKRQDLEAGVGFFGSQNASIDMILDLKYLRGEREGQDKPESKQGYGIEVSFRGLLMETLEMDVSGEYREFWQAEFGGRVGLQWQFSEAISVGAQYSYFKTEEKAYLGVRYGF